MPLLFYMFHSILNYHFLAFCGGEKLIIFIDEGNPLFAENSAKIFDFFNLGTTLRKHVLLLSKLTLADILVYAALNVFMSEFPHPRQKFEQNEELHF